MHTPTEQLKFCLTGQLDCGPFADRSDDIHQVLPLQQFKPDIRVKTDLGVGVKGHNPADPAAS